MRCPKQRQILRIILGVFILILFQFHSFSRWCANYTDNGFESSNTIQEPIARGAGYFLDSYANTMHFMRQTELSASLGMNYADWGSLLDRALESMKLANEAYAGLKQAADQAPYNPTAIEALKKYNYDNFQDSVPVNREVFAEVKMYLEKGDIRGVYGKILADTDNIIILLKKVQASVDVGKFPPVTDVWSLNQAYSNTLLFGQYVSSVFSEI